MKKFYKLLSTAAASLMIVSTAVVGAGAASDCSVNLEALCGSGSSYIVSNCDLSNGSVNLQSLCNSVNGCTDLQSLFNTANGCVDLKSLCESGNCQSLTDLQKILGNSGCILPDNSQCVTGDTASDGGTTVTPDSVVTQPSTQPSTQPPQSDVNIPDSGSEPYDTVSSYEQKVVELVNDIRAQYGLSALTVNSELSRVARIKSEDMRDRGYFSHTSPTYGSPFDMMKSFGISYRTAGENIAMGQRSPEAVVNAWMNSEGHRANILNSSFTQIGVGYAANGNYWTQMFIG